MGVTRPLPCSHRLLPGTWHGGLPGSRCPYPLRVCKQYILRLYCVCALKLCLQSKRPSGLTSPKWELRCGGGHLPAHTELPPPSAAIVGYPQSNMTATPPTPAVTLLQSPFCVFNGAPGSGHRLGDTISSPAGCTCPCRKRAPASSWPAHPQAKPRACCSRGPMLTSSQSSTALS